MIIDCISYRSDDGSDDDDAMMMSMSVRTGILRFEWLWWGSEIDSCYWCLAPTMMSDDVEGINHHPHHHHYHPQKISSSFSSSSSTENIIIIRKYYYYQRTHDHHHRLYHIKSHNLSSQMHSTAPISWSPTRSWGAVDNDINTSLSASLL